MSETKIEVETELKICHWCKVETDKIFYNYKTIPLCKKCLNGILKESRKTLNFIRNFVSK